SFDVAEVFCAAGCALVPDEFGAPDDWDRYVAERPLDVPGPRVLERQSGQLGQNIDTPRCDTDLVDDARRGEIRFLDLVHWGTKGRQRTDDAARVFRRRVDPDVEVACGTRSPVDGQRIRADDHEPHASVDERAQQIDKVFVHQ